ncbi:T-cell receptor alpha chain V region CTL-L17 [Heterocephalus glaber]|nr:T-cell receptor alpha chain V region CTL-L17 [Heterocephalus glaber]
MEMLLEISLMILWMQLSSVNGQQLNQSPQSITVQEGEDISMNCSSSSTFSNFQWYKQNPGEGLVLLLILYKSDELSRNGRLTAQLGGTRKDSFLSLQASKPDDTATYFCAEEHSAPQAPAACTQTCRF